MRIICNLRLSQLTYSNMRIIAYIGILSCLASAVFAQAADKDAIDLSGKMDTIERGRALPPPYLELTLGGFLNVGLKNSDQWEDFELIRMDTTRIRFGGPLIFDSTNNVNFNNGAYIPQLYGDFNGDGIADIIANQGIFFKGHLSNPYFDNLPTSGIASWDVFQNYFNSKGIDYDEDGIKDFLNSAGDHRVRVYKGGSSFGTIEFIYAIDSIQFPAFITSMEVGKFNPRSKPMVVCYAGSKLYLVNQTGNSFSQDSVIVVSDSAFGGIIVTNLYATDITGDGITDLIVSDGLHIYIFKGGDNFGTYQLIPGNAFYTIKSPRLTDFANYGFIKDFGSNNVGLRACGDLTGTGIPFLEVNANINEAGYFKSYAFFYAGGKALDTLFDSDVSYVTNGSIFYIDTLHSINSMGRTVCLINNKVDFNFNNYDLDFLMSRECEKIPHKTNPKMVRVNTANSIEFEASCYPSIANKFTKVEITADKFSQATITVFNLLGQSIQKRIIKLDPGENIEYFSTSNWTNGTYIVKIESSSGTRITKILVQH
jgi:hypothetical protein